MCFALVPYCCLRRGGRERKVKVIGVKDVVLCFRKLKTVLMNGIVLRYIFNSFNTPVGLEGCRSRGYWGAGS